MLVVTVSRRGQIAIPKKIMESLGIQEGEKLGIEVEDTKIILKPLEYGEQGWRVLKGIARGTDLLGEFQKEHQQEIERDAICS